MIMMCNVYEILVGKSEWKTESSDDLGTDKRILKWTTEKLDLGV
jgi:hypothetical protein